MEGKESESKADAPDSKGARAKPNEHQSKMNGDEAQKRAGTSQKKPKENGGQVNGEEGAGEAAAATKQRPKPKKSLPPGTDLWARITHEVNESKKEGNEPQAVESFGLLLGERGAGKSSLVQSFLNPSKGPDDRPKPSVALEYQFARRAGGAAAKDVAHLWELGGGMQATELICVAITPKQLQHAAFVVCVDLGRPENALGDLLRWLAVARRHMADCLRLIAKKRPPLAEAIRKAMVRWLAMADDNPDKRLIDPAPVPLAIVANKYDLFKDHAGVKRKALCGAPPGPIATSARVIRISPFLFFSFSLSFSFFYKVSSVCGRKHDVRTAFLSPYFSVPFFSTFGPSLPHAIRKKVLEKGTDFFFFC